MTETEYRDKEIKKIARCRRDPAIFYSQPLEAERQAVLAKFGAALKAVGEPTANKDAAIQLEAARIELFNVNTRMQLWYGRRELRELNRRCCELRAAGQFSDFQAPEVQEHRARVVKILDDAPNLTRRQAEDLADVEMRAEAVTT